MFNELDEIKKRRKRLGLNQGELSSRAGVSQSLIAKIEAGKIEPTYNKVKKIFEALSSLEEKEEVKARELMNKKVIFVGANEKVKAAIKVMKLRGISQVPVGKTDKVVGLVSEKLILEGMMEGDVGEKRIEEIMDDAPPMIMLETSQRVVLEILKEAPIVLVVEKGEVKGVISKSDLLGII